MEENRAKQKNKDYILTRDKYKSIKRYDHHQMEVFCSSIYASGVRDGYDMGKSDAAEEVLQVVAGVKGIGPKKMDEIRQCLFDKAD